MKVNWEAGMVDGIRDITIGELLERYSAFSGIQWILLTLAYPGKDGVEGLRELSHRAKTKGFF